jgi:hypothetical protein
VVDPLLLPFYGWQWWQPVGGCPPAIPAGDVQGLQNSKGAALCFKDGRQLPPPFLQVPKSCGISLNFVVLSLNFWCIL